MLITTGVNTRELTQPGIDKLYGAGVYYGASLAEAIAYKDQDIFIVAGANSAGQAAVFFARYASKVTILSRGSSLSRSMSAYLVKQIAVIENIEVLDNTEVINVAGSDVQGNDQCSYHFRFSSFCTTSRCECAELV